jgi:hypothetical protein
VVPESNNQTVFVHNLLYGTTEANLQAIFSLVGEIAGVINHTDKGFALITYVHPLPLDVEAFVYFHLFITLDVTMYSLTERMQGRVLLGLKE